ncbi:MAG: 3-methyladenine DNA glycosylase [Crocinitomicaceae bacterium]|nr:3-methyladenine DNA glycosylase [Crocinitomicaceae bacterium]|tara:strand:- start:28735 stop:29400 length:666 start_codon:yes stop_codon:yes gene_type:complete
MLSSQFFNRPSEIVAKDLVGKVIRRKYKNFWLASAIVETEAYGADKASHSYLGRTPSRESMWAPPGTIYMYMSQGGDSFNISVKGDGHAVLIKGGRPWIDTTSDQVALETMHKLNPGTKGQRLDYKLLAGQSLFARALNLKVKEWDGKPFDREHLYIEDVGYQPNSIIQCRRLGIPDHRDADLMLRYVDEAHVRSATQNPLSRRNWKEGSDYQRLSWNDCH